MGTEIIPATNSSPYPLSDDHWVIENVSQGITKRQIEAISERLEISMRAMAALLRIPERTLSRYKPAHTMKETVSEHALHILRIVDAGEDVFGDSEKFLRWLRQPCEALGGKPPLKLLGSITGARLVRDELVRIDYGVPY